VVEPFEDHLGKLLVIQSGASSREMICRRLEEAGYVTLSSQSGQDGLSIARSEIPDVVIADVNLPEAGLERLVSGLRAEKALQHTPVILLAPAGDTDAVERGLALGAEDFLYAPYSATALKAQVRDYLQIGKRRRQEQQRQERESLLKIERDVQIARDIQLGFLPKELPQPEGWEIAARFHPAREVAGDFYDAFTVAQGRRIGFVIADVCDKGVGAALFMALFRSLYRAYSMQHYSMRWTDLLEDNLTGAAMRQRVAPSTGTNALKNAMDLTNDYIAKNHADSNMFATTFFGMLDPQTGQLVYVNGGHNPPVIVSTVNGQTTIKAKLKPTGPAPGMFPNVDYKMGQAMLEPGETLFCFTDGCTDAKDPAGQLFGEKRLMELVCCQPAESATELVDRVDEALRAHIAEAIQFDDITMIAVQHFHDARTATFRNPLQRL
jgi:phosphoserine phosphatase RsbU/P